MLNNKIYCTYLTNQINFDILSHLDPYSIYSVVSRDLVIMILLKEFVIPQTSTLTELTFFHDPKIKYKKIVFIN